MIKVLLAILLFCGTWCIGQERNARLRLRARRLMHILDGLLCMEGEIRAYLAPLPSALAAAGKYDSLFAAAAEHAAHADGEAAFLNALDSDSLGREEKEVLSTFAKGLGAADVSGQLENLSACRCRLAQVADAAQKDVHRLGRLYSGAGAMTGILLIILLV